jgi:NADPH:quinone reductase-like Zn-dependent oxidoreductase
LRGLEGLRADKRMGMRPNQKDLLFVKELIETNKIAPVIDKRYTLQEVPEAIRYLEEGHAKGKVVIVVR